MAREELSYLYTDTDTVASKFGQATPSIPGIVEKFDLENVFIYNLVY